MRKFYFIVLAVIFGIIAISPALAQDGGTAMLEITSPKEGELITGDEILLNIKYSGESGNHAHIWLDEPNPTGDNAKTLENPGPFLFRDVKPGDHTIIVELAGGDHKPVDPAQKITLKAKTRSAADVTQEEIAEALKNIKQPESIKNNILASEEADPAILDESNQEYINSLIGKGVIAAAILICVIVIGGLIFFLRRSKKQE